MRKSIFLILLSIFGFSSATFAQFFINSDSLYIGEGAIMYIGTDFQTTGDNPIIEIGDSLFVTGNIDFAANTSVNGTGWLVLNGGAAQNLDFADAAVPKLLLDNFFSVVLGNDATINDSLKFQQGVLDIGAYDLSLGAPNVYSGGISGASTTSFIRTNDAGQLLRFANGNTAYPVGKSSYNPAVLNLSSPEIAGIRVEDEVYENYFPATSPETELAVNRAWFLSKSSNASANFKVSWKASDELSGFNRNSCALKYFDASSQSWIGLPYSAASFDGEFYSQTYAGLNTFNTYFAVFSEEPCANTYADKTVTACTEYTSPSGNFVYHTSGVYTDTIPNTAGCDSILTIDLTINPTYADTISDEVCGSYTFDGTEYTSTGVYDVPYQSVNSCDSIVTLDLIIHPTYADTIIDEVCGSYTFDGMEYTSTGVYDVPYQSVNGCDSVVTLDLTIHPTFADTITDEVCGSYTFDGTEYSSTGVYDVPYQSVNGCDSIVTLDLIIHPTYADTITDEVCGSYIFDGTEYSSTGVYDVPYQSVNGCDSIVTLDLIIHPTYADTISDEVCGNYTFDGTEYTSTGVYDVPYQSVNGCDSIVTLDLIIHPTYSDTITDEVCGSYTFDGTEYTSTGVYDVPYQSVNGCDSIVTLDLIIHPTYADTITDEVCGSYIFDGTEYSSTGIYDVPYQSVNGCDSIVTLNLTIHPTYADTIVAVSCGTYLFDGTEYTSTGIYEVPYSTLAGCDSIIILDLTVQDSGNSVCSSLNGSIDLGEGCVSRNLRVRLYVPGSADLIQEFNTLISEDGTYLIQYFSPGSYDIYLKPEGYLQRKYSSVEIVSGSNPLSSELFILGDVNENNMVNFEDFSTLNAAFGSVLGESSYNPLADFNCDGLVNFIDFSLLNSTYGQVGDEPLVETNSSE